MVCALMVSIEENITPLAKKITDTTLPSKHHKPPIHQLTEDSQTNEYQLPPRSLTSNTVFALIKLRVLDGKNLDPTTFTHIANLNTYQQALRAFPLIRHHPKFEKLHQQVHAYFHLKTNPPRHPNGKLDISTLTEQYRISKSTVHNWINDIRRPHLLRLLENRATTLKDYQDRLTRIRETDTNITTIQDLTHRLSSTHFMFAKKLQADPQLTNHLTNATKYLALLQLVEAGYHPRDLEIHLHLHKDYIGDLLRYHHRPHLIKLAANIPTETPPPGTTWLPTTTNQSNIPTRPITAPTTITNWHQLLPILAQLPRLDKPDDHLTHQLQQFGPPPRHLHQWKKEFGPITTPNDRLLALGYLIGTSLSDGWITQQSTYSSTFGLELSKKYHWAPTFGNRTAYYWTSIGIPTKQGPGVKPRSRVPQGTHNWWSVSSPLLTWFNEAVLGFQPGQTHTDTPAKIDWILKAPKEFQIKVLQGLFDGDGWANKTLKEISIHSHQNRDIIQQLLLQQGINAIQDGDFELVIHSNEGIKAAAKLPVFFSSIGRHNRALEAAQMAAAPRPSEKIYNPEVMLRVMELAQQGISKNRIRKQLFQEQNLVLSNRAINRIIRGGRERISHDDLKVKAFFLLLEQHIHSPSVPIYQLVRHVKRETGYSGHIDTMSGWLRKNKVPRDVKLAIAKGFQVDDSLLETYPYLRKYILQKSK
jgi:hypothetical protein